MNRFLFLLCFLAGGLSVGSGQPMPIRTGAEQLTASLSRLRGKNVAITTNQTGIVPLSGVPENAGGKIVRGNDGRDYVHIVDVLVNSGIRIRKVFSPEHGFRGEAEAGASVKSRTDAQTGLPIVSLYGSHKKPTGDDLQGIDLMLFDLQDVGVRFYTYISTLHYVLEACAEAGIPVWVLDRPNPHADYTDGPILDTSCCRSFVGMHPVPVVYGMTIGEYARMIDGEGWLKGGVHGQLEVIPLTGYWRSASYIFPVAPSPNLQTMKSVYAYPSLCFFEGTPVSVGRGTTQAFEIFGFPDSPVGDYRFTPRSIPGFSADPPYQDRTCVGFRVSDTVMRSLPQKLDLQYLIVMYRAYPQKEKFFNAFFSKLAGTPDFARQIRAGRDASQIRQSWRPALEKFESVRQKYLLYR